MAEAMLAAFDERAFQSCPHHAACATTVSFDDQLEVVCKNQRQASICVSAQTEMACPLIVRPRSEAMKTIWSAICCGVT